MAFDLKRRFYTLGDTGLFFVGDRCLKRKYITKLSADDCLGRLGRKNINDSIAYEYHENESTICFYYQLQKSLVPYIPERLVPYNSKRSCYSVSLSEADDLTHAAICYIRDMSTTALGVGRLDSFFTFKIDAEVDPEQDPDPGPEESFLDALTNVFHLPKPKL